MSDPVKEADAVMELRRKYIGYRPWQLVKVRGVDTIYECTSYVWQGSDGLVYVNARVIDDPTTNRAYKVRRQIAMTGWGHVRQKAFREGWRAGQAYMRFVQTGYAREREREAALVRAAQEVAKELEDMK